MLKKKLLFLLAFLIYHTASSQEVYFRSGKNFTIYRFKDAGGEIVNSFDTEVGISYELGYSSPIKGFDNFSYDVALTLNEFNAIVGVPGSSLKWKTEYAGVQGVISYSFVGTERFSLTAQVGYNVSFIVYGKAEVDAALSDLKSEDEFNGLIFLPLFGLEARLFTSEQASLSLGYNYLRSMDSDNGAGFFSMETNQIVLGIHFVLDQPESKVMKKSIKK